MADIEQWEIDLRNQLGNSTRDNKPPQEKTASAYCEASKNDYLLYSSMILFFILAALFILDFKTDFINKVLNSHITYEVKTPDSNLIVIGDRIGATEERVGKIEERIKTQEEKIFLLGVVSNENNFIEKKGLNKKDLLFISKNWKLKKYPKHIVLSDSDKKYLEKLIEN